jgi:hypothetical protein
MALAFVISALLIPRRGAHAPEGPPERGSFAAIRRDRAFLLFLLSGGLSYLVYVAYETVLPISLVDSHGLRPAEWGFLIVINPLCVTLFQLRLTRRVAAASPALKLVLAMGLMGFPFLLLSVSDAIPVIAAILVVFVIGEMLWVPTSQTVVAALAPADIRGALGPLVGLQIRHAYGDTAMWVGFAAIAVLAALTGALAVRGHDTRMAAVPVD